MEFNTKQKSAFAATVASGRLAHAYIIEGAFGIGKLTFAKHAAKTLLCTGDKKPCGKCASCIKSDGGINPDIHVYGCDDGATFKIATVRELIKQTHFLPNENEKSVFILNEAHKMTVQAQNALLKVFEEPPKHAVFFILTEKRQALLPTVLSRGQLISLAAATVSDVEAFLKQKFPKKSEDELRNAARLSGGSPGEALRLMEKSNSADRERTLNFLETLFDKNLRERNFKLISQALAMKAKRETVLKFFTLFQVAMRDIATEADPLFLTDEQVKKYKNVCSADDAVQCFEAAVKCSADAENNSNLTATLTQFCTEIQNHV